VAAGEDVPKDIVKMRRLSAQLADAAAEGDLVDQGTLAAPPQRKKQRRSVFIITQVPACLGLGTNPIGQYLQSWVASGLPRLRGKSDPSPRWTVVFVILFAGEGS
jgi:hypothetical protein